MMSIVHPDYNYQNALLTQKL